LAKFFGCVLDEQRSTQLSSLKQEQIFSSERLHKDLPGILLPSSDIGKVRSSRRPILNNDARCLSKRLEMEFLLIGSLYARAVVNRIKTDHTFVE